MTKPTGKPKGRPPKPKKAQPQAAPAPHEQKLDLRPQVAPVPTISTPPTTAAPMPSTAVKKDYKCGRCMNPINEGVKFCPSCGMELNWYGRV